MHGRGAILLKVFVLKIFTLKLLFFEIFIFSFNIFENLSSYLDPLYPPILVLPNEILTFIGRSWLAVSHTRRALRFRSLNWCRVASYEYLRQTALNDGDTPSEWLSSSAANDLHADCEENLTKSLDALRINGAMDVDEGQDGNPNGGTLENW